MPPPAEVPDDNSSRHSNHAADPEISSSISPTLRDALLDVMLATMQAQWNFVSAKMRAQQGVETMSDIQRFKRDIEHYMCTIPQLMLKHKSRLVDAELHEFFYFTGQPGEEEEKYESTDADFEELQLFLAFLKAQDARLSAIDRRLTTARTSAGTTAPHGDGASFLWKDSHELWRVSDRVCKIHAEEIKQRNTTRRLQYRAPVITGAISEEPPNVPDEDDERSVKSESTVKDEARRSHVLEDGERLSASKYLRLVSDNVRRLSRINEPDWRNPAANRLRMTTRIVSLRFSRRLFALYSFLHKYDGWPETEGTD